MKPKYRNLFLLFGIVAIVIMLYKFDFDFRNLRYIRWYWLSGIVGIWIVVYLFNAGAFYQIVNERNTEGRHLPFLYALKYTISGFAFSYATPFGFGGGPYRMLELGAYVGTRKAASSVVLYSMMHIFSHFCLWATAVILYICMYDVEPYLWSLFGVFALVCVVVVYFFYKGYRNGLVLKFFSIVSRIPVARRWLAPLLERNAEAFEQIDSQIAALHTHARVFYSSLAMEYVARVINSLEYYFIMLALGHPVTLADSLLMLAFSSLIGNLLFFFPMQLGAREGSLVMIVRHLSVAAPAAVGLYASVLTRIRELAWIIVGVGLVRLGANKARKP